MAHWVRCTTTGGADKETLVNLDLVVTVTPSGAGSRMIYSDGHTGYVDVAETPAEILALAQARGGF